MGSSFMSSMREPDVSKRFVSVLNVNVNVNVNVSVNAYVTLVII
ncbi:hypothetical protein BvCmsKSP009_03834 [Escherichia coli]|nr:hypothetical protein BvCmsKSP009_03834 [Escherichia coli]